MLSAGQIVAERYLLGSLIGEGAMGAVWRAEDQTLRRQVAIKFLFVKGARDPQAMVDQFLREARIAASVQHRNVISTVDFGTMNDFQPFMVMELLSGESLAERLERQPPLTREQVIHIMSLTLRGLGAVHDAGIVHRDLKPQNVFLQRDADAVYPKILDFGISRSLQQGEGRASAIATQQGLIVGTPDYMSPEQARGEADIDKRSDIYSMGVLVYEALTGQLPFAANTIGELIVKIMTREPPLMHEVAPDVPLAISEMVAVAMSKDREQRFADARAMRRALLAAVESAQPPGRRAAISVPPPESARRNSPLPPRGAPTAIERGSTWGDFEGLNAQRIVDRSLPPVPAPGAAPAPPPRQQQQRMIGHLDEEQPEQAGFALDLPQAGAAPDPRARTSEPRAPARARGGARRESASTAADALDPLYAGVEQAAPDIDYEKVGSLPRRGGAPVRRESPRTGRREPVNIAAPRRSLGLRGLAGWLLPIGAVLLAVYVLMKPPARSGEALPGKGLGARPALPGVPQALSGSLGSGLEHMHLRVRGRRVDPGKAPAHMRDVVF